MQDPSGLQTVGGSSSDRFGSQPPRTVSFPRPADGSGTAEQLTTGAYRVPTSVSSDGKTIVFRQHSDTTGRDIGMVRLEGEREPEMLLQTPFEEQTGMLSPDDRWLAYVSNESGREEVYVTPFLGSGSRVQISTEGESGASSPRSPRSARSKSP